MARTASRATRPRASSFSRRGRPRRCCAEDGRHASFQCSFQETFCMLVRRLLVSSRWFWRGWRGGARFVTSVVVV